MPEFTEDEIMLMTIYFDSKREWMIGNLMNMLSATTAEESELRKNTQGLIRKLSIMDNEHFKGFRDLIDI